MSTSSRKVQTLTLKQFTAFEEAVFEFSPGINVLIGSNSTGKTHLLKIIYTMLKVCKELYNMKGSADIIKNKDHVADMLLYGLFEKILRTDIDCFIRQNNKPYADKKITDIRLGYADKEMNIRIHPKELNYTEELPEPLPAIFLPAQEFLSINEGFISAYTHRELPYDATYYDLALALNALPLREDKLTEVCDSIDLLKKIIAGDNRKDNNEIITQQNGRFYFHLPEGELDARFVAEGYRKLATLYYLLKNGSLTKESILFWDEPEANLNPKLIAEVVRILQKLAKSGMQIFIATHDYLLSHELSLLTEYPSDTDPDIRFFALYRPDRKAGVRVESARTLAEIKNNPILEEFAAHYDRESELFYKEGGKKK